MCVYQLLSRVQLFATPWTAAHQAPLSMGFFRQEYWSRLPCPPQGDLPDAGIEPVSPVAPALQVDCLLLSHQESPLFLLTAIINSAAMNIGVHVSLSILVSSVCMPSSGIAGS